MPRSRSHFPLTYPACLCRTRARTTRSAWFGRAVGEEGVELGTRGLGADLEFGRRSASAVSSMIYRRLSTLVSERALWRSRTMHDADKETHECVQLFCASFCVCVNWWSCNLFRMSNGRERTLYHFLCQCSQIGRIMLAIFAIDSISFQAPRKRDYSKLWPFLLPLIKPAVSYRMKIAIT